MTYLYPSIYAVHNMPEKAGMREHDEAEVWLPATLQASSQRVTSDGAYLLDCGNVIYLWIGEGVSTMFLQDTFGLWTPANATLEDYKLDPSSTDKLSGRIAAMVHEIR